ncbi:MAG: hypothetical protein ABI686_00615 [Acidobacteriota bacterium]
MLFGKKKSVAGLDVGSSSIKVVDDTLKAFATAIDCKDKYIEGNSVRVGKYTEIICGGTRLEK